MEVTYKTGLMHCWLEVGARALMGLDMYESWATSEAEERLR